MCLIASLNSCYSQAKNETIVECEIYSTGLFDKIYKIKILENGEYNVVLGEKFDNCDNFFKIKEQRDILLQKSDLRQIKDLLKETDNHMPEIEREYIKKGGWEIIVKQNKKKYHYYKGEHINTPLDSLVRKIIILSPLKIDMQGNS